LLGDSGGSHQQQNNGGTAYGADLTEDAPGRSWAANFRCDLLGWHVCHPTFYWRYEHHTSRVHSVLAAEPELGTAELYLQHFTDCAL